MSDLIGERCAGKRQHRRLARSAVFKGLCLLWVGLFMTPAALALGLGQAQVESYLEQPLVARIDLISRSEAEMATVTAGLASPADFQVLGLTRNAIATPLEFEIYRDLSDPHIRVTSQAPMDEPVVQLVVEVVWASGRMLRQYTLFLDPPTFGAPAPLPAPSVRRAQPPVTVPEPEPDRLSDLADVSQNQQPPAVPESRVDSMATAREPAPAVESVPDPVVPENRDNVSPSLLTSESNEPIASVTPPERGGTPIEAPGLSPEVPAAGPPFDPIEDVASVAEQSAPMTEAIAESQEEAPIGPDPLLPEPRSIDGSADRSADRSADEQIVDAADELPAERISTDPVTEGPELTGSLAESDGSNAPNLATESVVEGTVGEAEPQMVQSPAEAEPDPAASLAEPITQEPAVEISEAVPEPATPVASSQAQRAEAPVEQPPSPFRAVLPEAGQALPDTVTVQGGDTLWSISGEYADAQGVSVNQVMLAVQQKNPSAFIRGNINALMAGQVLRMPRREEVLAQDARESMLEVLRQEAVYRTRWDLPPSPEDLPTISNLASTGSDAASSGDPGAAADVDARLAANSEENTDANPGDDDEPAAFVPEAEEEADDEATRLVLVPPTESAPDAMQGTGQGGSGETGVSSGESVVEELARTREELANAQQEKVYLEERLAELEAELSRRAEAGATGVVDADLASMEERLREERQAGEPEPEIELPPQESTWLSRFGGALAGLVVLILATLVWFLRSSRDPEYTSGITNPVNDAGSDPETETDATVTGVEESEDPETLLDLARAYMAMGKKTQARDCIEAVVRIGTPTQVREARAMLAEL